MRGALLPGVLLAGIVLLAHGAALHDGLFFDDHWHRTTLRQRGWSWGELIESATFDLPGPLAELWWQTQPLQWRYARPVAMLAMKIEYHLSGGDPVRIHACGLLWHLGAVLLVWRLACRALVSRGWALLAGALFAFYPHSVFSVSWIAARNVLVSAVLFLAATLLYWRATEGPGAGPRPGGSPDRGGGGAIRWLLAASCWVAALLARESAIVWPLVALALERAAGAWGRGSLRRQMPLWVLGAGYVIWRLALFPTSAAPPIYFAVPQGWDYLPWAAGKLGHLLASMTLFTPMFLGPGGPHGLEMGVLAAVVVLVILAALGIAYGRASRGVPTRLVWPIWLGAALIPVVPVFTVPHFSYLPAAAWVIMAALTLRGSRWRQGQRTPGWRLVAAGAVVAASLWSHGLYRVAWRGIVRSEQLVYASMQADGAVSSGHRAGTRTDGPGCLFLINHPLAAIYAAPALREAFSRPDLRAWVLTLAPHPLAMLQPAAIEQLNEREFILSTPSPGYFSGRVGRMLLDGTRPDSPLVSGTRVPGRLFDVEVLEADPQGATRLRFTFHAPLDSPEYAFYMSTPLRPARRIRFADRGPWPRVIVPDAITGAQEPDRGRWQAAHAAALREQAHYFQLMRVVSRIVRSDLYLTGADADR